MFLGIGFGVWIGAGAARAQEKQEVEIESIRKMVARSADTGQSNYNNA